jgi:AAA ATPase-like protein
VRSLRGRPPTSPPTSPYSGVVEVLTGGSYGLLDREDEIAAVAAAVALAPARNGGVLVVRGPAGIGKSALLRASERLAEEQNVIVLRARAAPFEREFPYGVVRQLFDPALARRDLPVEELLAGAASGARAVLGDEPRSSAAPDSQFIVLHGLYWLTANLASHAPLLICVDDVIWCDEASLRYLEFLVRRLEGMAAVVALAYRTGEPSASDVVDALVSDPLARVVQPRPLSEAALGGMLGGELGEEVDPGFCAACLEATGGNPLLVTELLRALETEHVRPRASGIARVRRIGAVAVGPAVRRRLSFLGEDVRGVARALAILGESARRDDLAGTSGIGVVELEDVIAALAGVGIVQAGERLSFVHPLVADAVRAGLAAGESAQLHQQAAKALVGRGAHGSWPRIWSPARSGLTRVPWASWKKRRAGRSPRAPRRQRSRTSAGQLLNWTQSTTRRRFGLRLAVPRCRPAIRAPAQIWIARSSSQVMCEPGRGLGSRCRSFCLPPARTPARLRSWTRVWMRSRSRIQIWLSAWKGIGCRTSRSPVRVWFACRAGSESE